MKWSIEIEKVKEIAIKIIEYCFPENKDLIPEILSKKTKDDIYSFISEIWINQGRT